MAAKNSAGTFLPAMITTIFAVSLQIQITLFASETYLGLRLNLTDFLLPLAGAYILASLTMNKTQWPHWQAPFALYWPAILTAVMTFGLIYGYLLNGELIRWALINKYAGWFVLMAYLGAGAWIGTNFKIDIEKFFLKPFLHTFLMISIVCTALLMLVGYGIIPEDKIIAYRLNYFQLEGFMGNRNAYAFLLMAVSGFAALFYFEREDSIKTPLFTAYWAAFPVFLLLNGSRILWPCTALLFLYLFFKDWKKTARLIVLPALIGAALLLAVSPALQKDMIMHSFVSTKNLYEHAQTSVETADKRPAIERGDNVRLEILHMALEDWKKHPVLGAGLGSIVHQQKPGDRLIRTVLDNSALWILTEMGAVGALAFGGAYMAMLLALCRRKEKQALAHCAFVMLLVFGLLSQFHELLYTRFMWFILGLALAKPRDQSPDSPQT